METITDESELEKLAESLSCSIFYKRLEIRRHQKWLDENEPVFENIVARLKLFHEKADPLSPSQ